jgi:hypothetical protein
MVILSVSSETNIPKHIYTFITKNSIEIQKGMVVGKKRGLLIVLLVFLATLAYTYASGCANPAESSYYCIGDVDMTDCCPDSASYYGEPGAPTSKSDCQTNFYSYSDSSVSGKCSDYGCCYISSDINCDTNSLEDICNYDQGAWNTASCSAVSLCTEGCCIYYTGTGDIFDSVISSQGYCSQSVGGIFNSAVTSASSCSALTAEYAAANIECNDGIDNDRDGYTDYPLDIDCISATDASESSTISACADGFDNDGDGYVDTADAGCCGNTDTVSEELCELAACGTGEISTACNCYSDAEGIAQEDGVICEAGNYCCDGLCQSSCGVCVEGERQYCGYDTTSGCHSYQYCQADGAWGSCEVSSICGLEPEVCTDKIDNDDDALVDCDDLDCYETQCGTTTDTSACRDKGFYYGGAYVCCSTNNVNDCNNDGTYETCGSCYCTTEPSNPVIEDITFTRGSAELTVIWELECPVEFNVLRCTGDSCTEDTTSMSETDIQSAFPEIVGANIEDAWSYVDTTIGVNERYCYVVQAIYPDSTNMYSAPMCVDDSGDYWCQQINSNEFCLDDYNGMDERLTYRAGCTDDNQVSYIADCTADYDANYICTGPDSTGTTACSYQSNCATCGDPLGLYATLSSGLAYYLDLYTETLCYQIPTCYYDYTLTTVDTYQECADVSSCYDYASQSACEEQYNTNGINNKCLFRNCQWIEFSSDSISNGICKELNSEYSRCDACNSAVHNGIFDACTEARCQEFGVDDATCYLSTLTNMCTDISQFTCTAYDDSTSCSGDHDVDVSEETNEIITPSEDALNIGLCYWNGVKCYKDANGDGLQDAGQEDMTPPTTIILSSEKMISINITLLARDLNQDGSEGDGVKETYYCITNDGTSCYPDTIVSLNSEGVGTIEAGDGSGTYDLYYFSVDYADNLEIVQHYSFDVDKKAPVIGISYYVSPDTSSPYDDSALTFEIILDEEAYCTDNFENIDAQIEEIFNDHFVTKYTGLTDGYYVYSVNCTDLLGNEGTAFVIAQIDADNAIFDSSPFGYVDSSSVSLEIKTLEDAECGFSENTEENSFEDMDEGFEKSAETGYYQFSRDWTLTNNGLYYYDIKCRLQDNSIHDDEITFVYDTTAPTTAVVDSYGEAFDFSAFYQGEELDMYLQCTDAPQYGLGCSATYYCLDATICTPTTVYETATAIPYDGTSNYFCYYSKENTAAGVGGLSETIHCTEINIDAYTPTLKITSPADRSAVYVPYVTVTGNVTDPDTTTSAINTATITVKNTNGTETSYTISATNGFSITVPLTLENNQSTYNTITVYGTDRSGAQTAPQTIHVRYTTELGDDAIWLVSPRNGVSTESSFELTVGTYLEAEKCGYSKNNISLEKSLQLYADSSDSSEYHYSASYTIDASKDGIGEYVYIKCLLENGVEYGTQFIIEYDTTKPIIEELELTNSDGKNPANIVEAPLQADISVTTDDRTKCKYSFSSSDTFNTGMTKFTDYDDAEYSTLNNDSIKSLTDNTLYTLYVACQNGGYLTSDIASLRFTVNTSAASDIYLISPEISGSRSFAITIGTTRTATSCSYGTTSDAITKTMTAVTDKQYKTANNTVSTDGNYTYYFSCWFADGQMTNYFMIPVDTTAPVIDYINDGNVSYSNRTLSAAWSASDSLTDVVLYSYSIGERPGYNTTFTWTNTTDKEAIAEGLSLVNQSTYYWNVKAMNEVGLWSSVSSSDGVLINTGGTAGTSCDHCETVGEIDYSPCSNSVKDDDETDVDCGGSCDACKAGDSCLIDDDCTSISCMNNICQESTCDDGIKNQGESDIDCGGNYCDTCEEGMACVYNRDCASGYCESKFCAAASCDDGVQNGDETDVDCGGSCEDCTAVIYQPQPPKNKEDVSEEGMAWWVWTLLFLLFISAGVGGYYGYVYYMKKKGKIVSFPSLGGLGLGKQLPSFNKLAKFPQKIQMPKLGMQKAQQQKQEMRQRVFKVFEETPKTEATKVPEKTAEKKTDATKPLVKKKPKLAETPVKPAKKEASKTFQALEKLIKEKK